MNYNPEDEYQKHIDAMFIEEQEDDDEEYLTQHWLFDVKKNNNYKTFDSLDELRDDLNN